MPESSNTIFLPIIGLWIVRLSCNEQVLSRIYNDPLLFAEWYCVAHDAIGWPTEAIEIRDVIREKKMSMERSLTLLQKLGGTSLKKNVKLHEARLLLEGFELHEWAKKNWIEFKSLADQTRSIIYDKDLESISIENRFGVRLNVFSKIMGFSPTEEKVFSLAFFCEVNPSFSKFLGRFADDRNSKSSEIWCSTLACAEDDLRKALSSTGVLRTSRLLKVDQSQHNLPVISDFWVSILVDTDESLFDSLLKPLVIVSGAGLPARLIDEDFQLAVDIIKNGAATNATGVNLLMYGADAFEKRDMLGKLLAEAGKKAFVIRDFEDSSDVMATVAYVAQRVLFDTHRHDGVLVIEKPGKVLERRPSEFFRSLFGIELDSAHIAPMDSLILETNPTPTIWAGPGADSLLEECVARFVFHAPLQRARREELRVQLESYVSDLNLGKMTKKELLALEDISSKQLESALRASKLCGATTKRQREEVLIRTVKRSLTALKRNTTPKSKECVTEYSLEYLNYSGRFGPDQILRALKLRPKGSLCLYGPPGTGKTQFVEYLAQQLGQRLIIKRASDLLSKYVGENEKNIAAMFQEAELEEAILFLDEGDSFLRDRSLAHQSWEHTKVNELLQGMERFAGIFIVATNLFRGLDTAALRRFTFKMELRALNPEQRWSMFVTEAGMKGTLNSYSKAQKDSWKGDLLQMHQLAAGDFATVKRQCILLGEALTPEQWIEQLQIECDVKLESQARDPVDEQVPTGGTKAPQKLVH